MRRMNYNPFEKPFASGEVDKINGRVVLDKPLEKGHMYIVRVFNTDIQEVSNTIIDLSATNYTSAMATITVSDQNDNATLYALFSQNDTPSYVDFTLLESSPNPTNYSFVIYLYKLF